MLFFPFGSQVCQHPNARMREWGAEARLQSLLLNPLKELSNIVHPDIRQKQLECVLQILQNEGDSLGPGWPLVLGVIEAIRNDQGTCLQIVVDVAGSFGLQNQELNISLTSIGLLWNISDYFFQRGETIEKELDKEEALLQKQAEEKGVPLNRPNAKENAMTLDFAFKENLPYFAVKLRAFKKKCRIQQKVRASKMSNEVFRWDFSKAWDVLLDHIQSAALSKNNEVSLAALKSCQEILQIVTPVKDSDKSEGLSGVNMPVFVGPLIPPPRTLSRTDSLGEKLGRYIGAELSAAVDEIEDSALWWAAWNTWYKIGLESTKPPTTCDKLFFIPSQPFLTALVQIFPALYQHIKSGFSMEDLKKLGVILHGAVSVPISSDASPFILPSYTEAVLTSLQEAVLISLDVLQK
eukprot:g44817.t1